MIYRLIVNAAFLAVGYYIGKEVGRLSRAENDTDQSQASESPEMDLESPPSDKDDGS